MGRKIIKKYLPIICAFVLVLILAVPVYAIKNSSAITMRLEKIEGAIILNSQNGNNITARNGSKLYSGYSLTSRLRSYAYINLDDTKVVKLDEASSAIVKKSGQKLELLVKSGKIFFNIKRKLNSGESLEIRTETMVTGIRGTSGIVEKVDENVSVLYLLDGEVTLTAVDPITGEKRQVTVKPGEKAIIRKVILDNGEEAFEIEKEEFKEEDIAGFAAEEIKKDKELQERIKADTELDIQYIIENADERLKRDQEESESRSNRPTLPPPTPTPTPSTPTPSTPEPDIPPTPEPDTPPTPDIPPSPAPSTPPSTPPSPPPTPTPTPASTPM